MRESSRGAEGRREDQKGNEEDFFCASLGIFVCFVSFCSLFVNRNKAFFLCGPLRLCV